MSTATLHRRAFLTAVAAGVAAALTPALPGRSAARLPGDLAYATMTHDATAMAVRMGGTTMIWKQLLRDYLEAERIGARVDALCGLLDVEIT